MEFPGRKIRRDQPGADRGSGQNESDKSFRIDPSGKPGNKKHPVSEFMFQFTGSRHGIKDEKTQFNKKCQQHIYTAGTAFGKELRAEQKYDSGTKGFRSGKF